MIGLRSNMLLFRDMRLRMKKLVGPFVGLFTFFYFTYHILHGERGVFAWTKINDRVVEAKLQLKKLKEKNEVFEHRVKLLHPEHLDPDLLEERARAMLNYGYSNELVVIETKDKDAQDRTVYQK